MAKLYWNSRTGEYSADIEEKGNHIIYDSTGRHSLEEEGGLTPVRPRTEHDKEDDDDFPVGTIEDAK